MKKKLLITGISGLLGSNLAYCLRGRYIICGIFNTHPVKFAGVDFRQCDLTVKDNLQQILDDFQPDVIIHSAAQANVDICEENPLEAERANVLSTKNVFELITLETKCIYISTDLVYAGQQGNNSEQSPIGPLNVYAKSKLKGEEEAMQNERAVILRTNFFGWSVGDRQSLGEWVISKLSKKQKFQGFIDAKFSSIYTFDLARILDEVIVKDIKGVYNLGSRTHLSKYKFAVTVAKKLGFDSSLISPVSIDDFSFAAKRSKDLSMDVSKIEEDLGVSCPTIEESIDRFVKDYAKDMPSMFKSLAVKKKTFPDLEYIPYGRQSIDEDDIDAVVKVLKSSNLTQGKTIKEFESKLCEIAEANYAIAVNSGTSALHVACLAAGVKEGDEGITSPITFVASANCIAFCKGTPVFADINPETYNLSPEDLEKKITEKTKVVIPVHFAGQSCDMEAIARVVKQKEERFGHKIFIIEDASHAIGSKYKGQNVGGCEFSDMAVMSFHPVKHITTAEGGCVLTNCENLSRQCQFYRSHGITSSRDELVESHLAFDERNEPNPWYYEQQLLGFNYRITDIQCALGLSQLKKLSQFSQRRKEIVKYYNDSFQNVDVIVTPREDESCLSNFHLYVLQFDFEKIGCSRSMFMKALGENGVRSQVHYIPVHLQPFYQKSFGTKKGDCPNAEEYYRHCLSIPLYPDMKESDIRKVVTTIMNVIEQAS